MKKVAFIGHRNLYFGAESVMFRVIKFLKVHNLSTSIIVLPKSKDDGFSSQLKNENINDIKLSSYKLIGGGYLRCLLCLAYNAICLIELCPYLKSKKIDTVYSNTSVNILGAMISWVLGTSHIWHFHEQPTGGTFKWIPTKLFPIYRFFIRRRKTTIIFISKVQKDLWEKEFDMKISNCKIIYTPPVNLPDIPVTQKKEKVVFGFLGSWTESKNLLSLITVYTQLIIKYPLPLSKLVLMGDGDLKSQIKSIIKELNMSINIELLPHSTNVTPFFEDIDIFVLPSFFESWGLVVLEALSQKKAVICTSNTGLTEILKPNEDCIFVDPFDNNQLFVAMEKLLLDAAMRERMALSSFETLKNLQLTCKFEHDIKLLFN